MNPPGVMSPRRAVPAAAAAKAGAPMKPPYSNRNRRTGRRVYLRTQIDCLDSGGSTYEGALGNLGEGGVFIHAPAPYPPGTRLAMRFELRLGGSARTLHATGEVVWVRRAQGDRLPGFGVRFTGMERDEAGIINRLLALRREERRALGFA